MSYEDIFCKNAGFKLKKSEKKEEFKKKLKEKQNKPYRYKANGNISSIASAMETIGKVLNVVMDRDIGFGEEFNRGKGYIPFITYSTLSREASDITPLGTMKTEKVMEVANGEYTGDVIEYKSKFFDCIIEFNIFGNDTTEANELLSKFEEMMETYKGSFKSAGISDIYFLKEVDPSNSTKVESFPNKTICYYIRLQKIWSVRLSTLESITSQINEKIKEVNPNLTDYLDNLTSNNTLE